jgi:hypothetical protein
MSYWKITILLDVMLCSLACKNHCVKQTKSHHLHSYVALQKAYSLFNLAFTLKINTDWTFYICHLLEKNWVCKMAAHYLFTGFTDTYNLVSREVLYILTQFCTPIKPVWIINIHLNKIYRKVHTSFIETVFETGGIFLNMVTTLQVP